MHRTTRAGDALETVEKYGNQFNTLVCFGGDGTMNEVINGSRHHKVRIALVPVGTGNVLKKELNLDMDINRAARIILAGKTQLMDIAYLNGKRMFMLFAGIGFDAQIVHSFHALRRGPTMQLHYFFPILRTITSFRFQPLSVTIDHTVVEKEATYVMVSNVRSYGGPIEIASKASPNDGLLDICIFLGKRKADFINYALGAITRTLHHGMNWVNRDIKYFQGKQIIINSPEPVPVQVDGDPAGFTPAVMEVQPRSISLLVP